MSVWSCGCGFPPESGGRFVCFMDSRLLKSRPVLAAQRHKGTDLTEPEIYIIRRIHRAAIDYWSDGFFLCPAF